MPEQLEMIKNVIQMYTFKCYSRKDQGPLWIIKYIFFKVANRGQELVH